MRLYENNCDVPSILKAMTLLFTISLISISILSSHTFISNLTWDVACSAIQTEFSKWTNTTNATCYSGIPYGNKLPQ